MDSLISLNSMDDSSLPTEKYIAILDFSVNNFNWFFEGLAKNIGIKVDTLKSLKSARNIDYNAVFLLNKSLTLDTLHENIDLLESHGFFLAHNESDIWNKEILDLLMENCQNDNSMSSSENDNFFIIQNILSTNKKVVQDISLLVENNFFFDWRIISSSKDIVWDKEKIFLLKDYLSWDILSTNPFLPWDKELIQAFEYKWNWLKLSKNLGIDWNTDMINTFRGNLNWEFYTCNHKNLSVDIIAKNIDKWDWQLLSSKHDLPWSSEFIEEFKTKWDWDELYRNESINWDNLFLPKCSNENAWNILSHNKGSFWNIELIVKYYFILNLESLSQNPGLPWSVDLFNLFKNRIEIKKEHLRMYGKIIDYEDYEDTGLNENSDYYVDPNTDIVFIQGNKSIDQIIADYESQEDRDACTDWNYDPDNENIIKDNPLLNNLIWNKMFDNILTDKFINDVLNKGIKLKFDPSKIDLDFE